MTNWQPICSLPRMSSRYRRVDLWVESVDERGAPVGRRVTDAFMYWGTLRNPDYSEIEGVVTHWAERPEPPENRNKFVAMKPVLECAKEPQ